MTKSEIEAKLTELNTKISKINVLYCAGAYKNVDFNTIPVNSYAFVEHDNKVDPNTIHSPETTTNYRHYVVITAGVKKAGSGVAQIAVRTSANSDLAEIYIRQGEYGFGDNYNFTWKEWAKLSGSTISRPSSLPGAGTGAGEMTDPGTTTEPGEITDPGTTTEPGEITGPGTTTEPGEITGPGPTVDPGATNGPGETGCPGATEEPGEMQ